MKIPMISEVRRGVQKRPTASGDTEKIDFVEFDLVRSGLSRRMIDLIREGKDLDAQYSGDRSSALFAALLAMVGKGFTDIEIVSVLTDRENFLGEVAFDHAKSNSRERAAKWLIRQNLKKAKRMAIDEIFEREESEKTAPKSKSIAAASNLTFENFKDIAVDRTTHALVDNFIDHNALVLIYGESNSGKTFFTLDLAMHIALGKRWQDRKVNKGSVLYIAAEGGRRIKDRVVAFREAKNLQNENVPFRLARGSIDLLDDRADIRGVIEELQKTEEMFDEPIRMVVIDTLSRAIAGGDENASSDMGKFVANIDRIRSKVKDAAVVVVHHTGKDVKKGARGHSLLRAAVDTEIEVSEDGAKGAATGTKIAKTTKQRDYEGGQQIGFSLKEVEIGSDSNGRSIRSCVVQPINLEAMKMFGELKIKPGSRAEKALSVFKELLDNEGLPASKKWGLPSGTLVVNREHWRTALLEKYFAGVTNRKSRSDNFTAPVKQLKELGIVQERENEFWLVERDSF